eukprot:1299027-Ditylum_brightwellii.AAC.1
MAKVDTIQIVSLVTGDKWTDPIKIPGGEKFTEAFNIKQSAQKKVPLKVTLFLHLQPNLKFNNIKHKGTVYKHPRK